MRRPIVIDCDPGIDDAVALMMLQASGAFELRGITAVHGNVGLGYTAMNALFLSELYGIDCPVAKGAEHAMIVSQPKAQSVHGGNGLGDFRYERPKRDFYPKPAWELLYEQAVAAGGELEIFASGPLTNLAIAVLKYPKIVGMIRRVIVMGGAARAGNAAPYAEFNIRQDPHAASVVLGSGFSSLTLVDLDCCYTGYLTDEEADRMLSVNSALGPLFGSMRRFQQQRNQKLREEHPLSAEFAGGRNIYCDAVAAAVAIHPEIASLMPCYVFCETESALNFGQTVADWNGRFNQKPNLLLARGVDRERFVSLFFRSFGHYGYEREREAYE